MDLDNLDFQQARIKQVVFKSRLRSVLYGVRAPDPGLCARGDNPFGQWLTATLVPRLGPTAQVRRIEQVLEQMLRHGQDLVRAYQNGQIETARAGLDGIEAYATEIEVLLQQLERRPAV
jgi:hypothetical protein